MRHHTKQRGFTLLETLIAISVLITAIIGPMTIAARGLQSAYFAKEQLIAINLAQEGLEVVRKERDNHALLNRGNVTNWYAALPSAWDACKIDGGGSGCDIDILGGDIYDCSGQGTICRLSYKNLNSADALFAHHQSGGTQSPYTRVITIEDVDGGSGDDILVTSRVSWTSPLFFASPTRTITLQTNLLDRYDTY